jgi:hypothetical protein
VSSLTGLVQFLLRLPRTDVLGYSQPSLSGTSAEFSRRLSRLDLCSALNGPTKLTLWRPGGDMWKLHEGCSPAPWQAAL